MSRKTKSAEFVEDDSNSIEIALLDKQYKEVKENMRVLKRQVSILSEKLYKIRKRQIDEQESDFRAGAYDTYEQELSLLKNERDNRFRVAASTRQYKLQSIENKYLAEVQAANQDFENEKNILYHQIRDKLLRQKRKLLHKVNGP